MESIRSQTGLNAVGLLGNDHFHTVDALLDLPRQIANLSTSTMKTEGFHETHLHPIRDTLLNSVDVYIDGIGLRRMLLDTGAKFSYLEAPAVANSRSLGPARDFQFTQFGLEQLDVELHEIEIRLGSILGKIRCASHPRVIRRLQGTDAVGILGWDILKYGQVLHSPMRGRLFTRPGKADKKP